MKKTTKTFILGTCGALLLALIVGLIIWSVYSKQGGRINEASISPPEKPVIYLYPTETTDVSVKVNYIGDFSYTYPTYENGWEVTAEPDGTLVNKSDNSQHYYLFWEGAGRHEWQQNQGFVVKGSETEEFLIEKLSHMGLTPREYNDFIVYWLPRMQNNPYNLITFSPVEEYDKIAPLQITPQPDSILRIHMAWKSLDEPISIPEQKLEQFYRNGFTVVEWGGSEIQ